MPERPVSNDPPSVTVAEIRDPAIAGENLELVDLDAVQLTSAPFRARRVVVRLEGGAVVYHSTNHRIRTRTKAQGGRLAYATFDARARGTVNGLPIHPELVVAVEPETEVVFVTDAGYESITLLAPAGGHPRPPPRPAPRGRLPLPERCGEAAGGRGQGPAALRLGEEAGGHGRAPARAVQRP